MWLERQADQTKQAWVWGGFPAEVVISNRDFQRRLRGNPSDGGKCKHEMQNVLMSTAKEGNETKGGKAKEMVRGRCTQSQDEKPKNLP